MAYQRIVHVINRTTVTLEVTDDGVVWVIPAGYKRLADGSITGTGPHGDPHQEPIPFYAAHRAIVRNKIMGTEDPGNPNSFQSLIACPAIGWKDVSHIEQSEAIEALDRSLLPEAGEVVRAIGGRKTITIPGRPATKDPTARNSETVNAQLAYPNGRFDERQPGA
jgi:hypothetical protein